MCLFTQKKWLKVSNTVKKNNSQAWIVITKFKKRKIYLYQENADVNLGNIAKLQLNTKNSTIEQCIFQFLKKCGINVIINIFKNTYVNNDVLQLRKSEGVGTEIKLNPVERVLVNWDVKYT